MSIKGSAKHTFKLLQIMQSTSDFIDEQRNADMLDAMSDIAYEQEQAMRESEQSEWDGIVHEDLDDPSHWSATRASSYSRDDETAMAAFNYPSDSCEADRWR